VAGVSEAERAAVLAEGTRRGWPAEELDAAIAIESAWNPSAMHPVTRAGGLIGFMPFVLRQLGWKQSPEAFFRLSGREQAPWVGRYFDLTGTRWRVPGDTYLALAAPRYVGASDATIVYPRGSEAWQLNPGWRDPMTGEITAGSIRRVLLRRMQRGRAALPRERTVSVSGWGAIVLVGVLGWLAYKLTRPARARRAPLELGP
jgi:hypothetical protein